MKRRLRQLWSDDGGMLSFEWVLLITLVVIGIVGGLCAARDAIIDELGDIAEAAICFDQSYSIAGSVGTGGFPPSRFTDTKATFSRCDRATGP